MAIEADRSLTISCPSCGGRGSGAEEVRRICETCHGAGVCLWSNGSWLRWTKQIDAVHLVEERAERLTHATIDALLLGFGIVGVALGVYGASGLLRFTAASSGILGAPDFLRDLVALRSPSMLLFWLSLLTDLYLFYRFEQSRRIVAPIQSSRTPASTPAQTTIDAIDRQKAVEVSLSYTRSSLMVVEHAFLLASRLKQATVEPIHLLAAGAVHDEVGIALVRLGIHPKTLREMVHRSFAKIPRGDAEPVLSEATRLVLLRAYECAETEHLLQVTPPHLFEAIAMVASSASEILFDLGADQRKVHDVVLWSLMERRLYHSWSRMRQQALNKPKSGMDRAMTAQATPVLDHYSTDLTQHARRGTLQLVLDREEEIDDIFRVVESGRHNVILVGEKGVGTTSILHAIAERMAAEDVPAVLQDKRFVQLSVSSLVSGAGGGGQLEKRLEEIIVEIVKAGNIILAIEDIHELVGVSTVSGDSLDLASILGKVLNNRVFVAFATTTPDGYRRYVEPSALFVEFEKVEVKEVPSPVAVQILESKASSVEALHRVFFSYAAIEKIVSLSIRYIHDRYLPEKALTLLEEVAAYTHAAKGDRAVVSEQDAAAVVSRRTKANVSAVTEDEATKLIHLEERLHERMVGQDYAIKAVANALRRSRAELRDPKRPIAVFLFLGPTGVGKTELAKTVAEVYFGNEENMIRLDMSEYQDPSSLARLLGAPPGYAGATAGYLTEAVRTNPFSLVLLDELEKAHPDILNVFLQVFDDGRLTDSHGRTIDFTNTIIIATSNAGTDLIQQRMKEGREMTSIREELIETTLGRYFRPEFLNRFDDIIVFAPLSESEIEEIAHLLLRKIMKQLEQRGITFRATPEAIHELAQAGFDPIFGARPLRRVLQERVDNALATHLLTGKLGRRDVAVLEPGGVIRVERAELL